jgi:stearoyl-CoA desaturase (delta-9 desaturase)
VGWSWIAVVVAIALYFVRMFAVTGFYHRYFSHRSFKTSRAVQFVFGIWANSAVQRGPIWWASQHRQHHAHSDDEDDAHSPSRHGLYWSHIGWLTARDNLATNERYVRDLLKFPELRFLNRFDVLIPVVLAALLFLLGWLLQKLAPSLETSGPQMLVWGFFISTTALFHATCTINSLSHVFGSRRFAVKDTSRNNWLLALLTLGEGWHNNHHRYPASARQGFYWWEIDLTYYGLKVLQRLRLIWDLRPVPARVLAEAQSSTPCEEAQ